MDWVHRNSGRVCEVERWLVFRVAFDGIHLSPHHKSGPAMRFLRIGRIRWDKSAAEADRIEALEAMGWSGSTFQPQKHIYSIFSIDFSIRGTLLWVYR